MNISTGGHTSHELLLLRQAAGKEVLHKMAFNTGDPRQMRSLGQVPPTPPMSWRALELRCHRSETPHKRKATLRSALSPRPYPVPHTVRTAACRCSLAGTRIARRFRSKAINHFLAALFDSLPDAIEAKGLPPVHLSRYDLHHAHIFLSLEGFLGLLFHSKEYVAAGDVDLGHLGYCQCGTPLKYEREAMAWRNIIWIDGKAASFNVGPTSPLNETLLMDGLHEACTVLESDLGEAVADVYFVAELAQFGRLPGHRIFVVPH